MIVVSDVDRTLLDPGEVEGVITRRFFSELLHLGATFGLASSRSRPSIEAVLPAVIRDASFAICSDGALLYRRLHAGTLEVTRRALLRAPREVVNALSELRPVGTSLFIFNDDRSDLRVDVYLATAHEPLLPGILQGRPHKLVEGKSAIVAQGEDVLSIGILGTEGGTAELVEALSATDSISEHTHIRHYEDVRLLPAQLFWCDLSSIDADKGPALDYLLSSMSSESQASVHPIIALADGHNDISMVARSDVAFCPPWSDWEVRKRAKVVDGVVTCTDFLIRVGGMLDTIARSGDGASLRRNDHP